MAQAALGQDPQGQKIADRIEARHGDTLSHIYQRYLAEIRTGNKSWKQPDYLMREHVLGPLGVRKIKEITQKDIWRIFDGLHDRPALANQVVYAVSAVFTWAVKRQEVPDNPCRGIEHHKTKSVDRFLSNEEIRAVWPLLGPSDALKLVLLTAQRPGEVCSMRWEHLDLDAGFWVMPGQPAPGWKGTKNKREHEVPLTNLCWRSCTIWPKPSGHVFPSARPGRPLASHRRRRFGQLWRSHAFGRTISAPLRPRRWTLWGSCGNTYPSC